MPWQNHAIFAPFLAYSVSVWGLTYPSLSIQFLLQTKILRVITFSDKNAPSTSIFDSLKVLKFNDMITMHIVSPAYFSNYFTWIENVHSFGTRQSRRGELFALRCNTTQYGLRSVHYSGVRLGNYLPTDIRNSVSLSSFRSKIKSYFLSAQLDTYIYVYIIYRILINV